MPIASQRPEFYPGLPVTEGMLIPTERDLPPIPLKHTDMQVNIIGPICDVLVTQQFHNTHQRPVEAIYVFPLPEDAAVTALTLTIGERVIRGEIREREQARHDYEQARDQGQGAALLEQERPNLFTISVANIQPDEQVQVSLRFHDHVPYNNNAFEFVLPTVVLPRYVPPQLTGSTDMQRVTNTPLLSADTRDGHTLSITVILDMGKLVDLNSPTHAIDVQPERGATRVTLRQADAIPNKDFILRYQVASAQFDTAAFTYRPVDEAGTLLLMLTPRVQPAPEYVLPRELLFVFDRSGSMSGDSIVQARNALRACLRALNPEDRFNIFPFDNRVEQFAPQPVPFTQANIDRADDYIEQIDARGGTEILLALQTALQQPRDAERLRVVVFMTDGAVGNEDQVLRELRRTLNEARVYAFGIGTAVNRFLLDKLAEVGRGTVEYIFPGQAIEDAVQRFQNRAAFPVLVDLNLDWGGARVTDVYPYPLPDLYAGQPLLVLARFHSHGHTQIRLTGRTTRGEYTQTLAVDWPQSTPDRGPHWATLKQLWARARIDALLTRERDTSQQQSKLRDEILGLALAQGLLCPYTSFVAIEERRGEHADREAAQPVVVPIHLPQGTRREAFESPPGPIYTAAGLLGGPGAGGGLFRAAAVPSRRLAQQVSYGIDTSVRGRLHKMGQALGKMLGASPEPAMLAAEADTMMAFEAPSPAPVQSEMDRQAGTAFAPAVRREAALRYLARVQGVSGAWGESPVATALVVLAFLRQGHTDRTGNFRPQLTRAIRWLSAQAQQATVSPAVAWALAELAGMAGGSAELVAARDRALAHATASDDLDRACLALAQHMPHQPPTGDPQAWLHDERGALALALYAWDNVTAAQTIADLLAPCQHHGGSADGAFVPSGSQVNQPTAALFALTAVGILV